MGPILFLKAHVSGYTRKDGTYVAEHEDSRHAAKKHADVKADRIFSMLADAEDSGGKHAALDLANDIIQHRPDLADSVRSSVSDLGYSLPMAVENGNTDAGAASATGSSGDGED